MTFPGSAPSDLSAPELGTIAELTFRCIGYRSIELALFDLVGTWITSGSSGLVRAHAAAWSQHHAWHADLWAGRLPRTPVLPDHGRPTPEEVTGHRTALATLVESGVGGADVTPEQAEAGRIAVYAHGVLAGLDEILTAHRDAIDPALDGPTARVLDLVLADVRRDRATAGRLADALGGPDETGLGETGRSDLRRRMTDLLA